MPLQGTISRLAHGHVDAVTVPAAVGLESTAPTETNLVFSGSQGLLPLWNPLNLHTDPGVQLVKVFQNSIGDGGIPHPAWAKSEKKEILRNVISFTFSWWV